MNVEEKKILYHSKIQNVIYDRTIINDTKLNFDYLTHKQNYNPLAKHHSFLHRMLFVRPMYAQSKEISMQPSMLHYIVRILGSLFLVKFGYELAHRDFEEENNIYSNNKLVSFDGEEQIFDLLYHKDKTAVFL